MKTGVAMDDHNDDLRRLCEALAANTERMRLAAEAQRRATELNERQLMSALADVVAGHMGGRGGLDFSSPSFEARIERPAEPVPRWSRFRRWLRRLW